MLTHLEPQDPETAKKCDEHKTPVKRGSFWPYRVGRRLARRPLSPTERRELAFGNATARGPLAGFKRLRATAGQGPNYVGPLCGYVGLCWRMLAYLAGNVGPSCGLLAYVGLMLTHVEPKDPKNGNSKKSLFLYTVKRRIF